MNPQTDWSYLGTLDAIELLSRIELTLLTEPVSHGRMDALHAIDGALRHLFKYQPPTLQRAARMEGTR